VKKLKPETIENLEWLKGRLRKYPHRYDQDRTCGAQACLYGYCLPRMLNTHRVTMPERWAIKQDPFNWNPTEDWAKWLGVSGDAASRLYAPVWHGEAAQFNRLPTDTNKQATEKARQRIDLFIQSGGTK
jgi:hypothetical protein